MNVRPIVRGPGHAPHLFPARRLGEPEVRRDWFQAGDRDQRRVQCHLGFNANVPAVELRREMEQTLGVQLRSAA